MPTNPLCNAPSHHYLVLFLQALHRVSPPDLDASSPAAAPLSWDAASPFLSVRCSASAALPLLSPRLGLLSPVVGPMLRSPGVGPVLRSPVVGPVLRSPGVGPVLRSPGVRPVLRSPGVGPVLRSPGTAPPLPLPRGTGGFALPERRRSQLHPELCQEGAGAGHLQL